MRSFFRQMAFGKRRTNLATGTQIWQLAHKILFVYEDFDIVQIW